MLKTVVVTWNEEFSIEPTNSSLVLKVLSERGTQGFGNFSGTDLIIRPVLSAPVKCLPLLSVSASVTSTQRNFWFRTKVKTEQQGGFIQVQFIQNFTTTRKRVGNGGEDTEAVFRREK